MLQVYVCEVKMHAFHQHVGGDKHLLVGVVHHGAVVAHTHEGGGVVWLYVFCKVADKPEFS